MTGALSAVGPDGIVLGDEKEIPDGIAALMGRSTDGCRVKILTPYSCVLTAWDSSHEFRFQKRGGGEWEWDEVVGRFFVHVEQMSDHHYWIGLTPLDASGDEIDQPAERVCLDIVNPSGRALIRMTGWMD